MAPGLMNHEILSRLAAQLISTLYQFVPRVTNSQDAVVLSFGRVTGGHNANVIPEQVELSGTLRTLEAAVRDETMSHIRRLARGVEEIAGTQIEVVFEASIPAVYNDHEAVKLVSAAAADVVGAAKVQAIPRPSMGSEDFACFLEHAPGAMFRLGVASDMGAITRLHTAQFDVDESALPLAVRILARTVVAASQPRRT